VLPLEPREADNEDFGRWGGGKISIGGSRVISWGGERGMGSCKGERDSMCVEPRRRNRGEELGIIIREKKRDSSDRRRGETLRERAHSSIISSSR